MVRAYCGLKMVHSMALDSTASPHNRQEGAGHNRQEIKQDSTTAWRWTPPHNWQEIKQDSDCGAFGLQAVQDCGAFGLQALDCGAFGLQAVQALPVSAVPSDC